MALNSQDFFLIVRPICITSESQYEAHWSFEINNLVALRNFAVETASPGNTEMVMG